MEITLEKIELVKDRTGVSYREAKDALEACDGSVVDAIIAIEENIDAGKAGKTGEYVKTTMAKVKELVNKGNISKISVKRGDESIVNIPVNVGIVGAVLAPWGVIAAAIAAFGFKCKVELTTDDGKVIDVSEKVETVANTVKEKGSVVVDEIKERGGSVVGDLKEKAPDYVEKVKDASQDAFNNLKEKAPDYVEKVKDASQDAFNNIKDKVAGEDDFEIEIEIEDEDINQELNK
jgi:gas vesicle protein